MDAPPFQFIESAAHLTVMVLPDGLESSTIGLNFLVLPEHFRGPEMELWATCETTMPSIHGVELLIEGTLLLSSLNNKLQYYQGGWATAGLRCDRRCSNTS